MHVTDDTPCTADIFPIRLLSFPLLCDTVYMTSTDTKAHYEALLVAFLAKPINQGSRSQASREFEAVLRMKIANRSN